MRREIPPGPIHGQAAYDCFQDTVRGRLHRYHTGRINLLLVSCVDIRCTLYKLLVCFCFFNRSRLMNWYETIGSTNGDTLADQTSTARRNEEMRCLAS